MRTFLVAAAVAVALLLFPLAQARSIETPDQPPIPDEPPLETFRDNLVIGDPHYVAEKLVSEIGELGTTHLSCFMQIGSVDGRRATRGQAEGRTSPLLFPADLL